MSVPYRQDMPPPGGFEAIKYKRNLPLKGPSGLVMFLGVMGVTSFGMYRVLQGRAEQRELKREKIWSRIHLTPLLIAEADRDAYRREQAALSREKAIMKDVPGWVPGKSVYNNPKFKSEESIVLI